MLISSLLSIGLGLAIGLPFVIVANNLIRRSARDLHNDMRAHGVDPEQVRLMVIAQMQADEKRGFHPMQWFRRKAILWSFRHQT